MYHKYEVKWSMHKNGWHGVEMNYVEKENGHVIVYSPS